MADEMSRFTAWMTERERYELTRIADKLGLSQNVVLRTAYRVGLGLPVNADLAAAVRLPQPKDEHETSTATQG
jgi:hypothetical protein